jgi:Zinc knuckle
MNIDARIARVKELIAKREQLDAELNELLGGTALLEKRSPKCSTCGEHGHRSTTCPSKQLPQIT